MKAEPLLLRMNDGTPVTPELWDKRRAELIDILCNEEYGYSPAPPETVTGRTTGIEQKCCSGHAVLETVEISFQTDKGTYSFPVNCFFPNDGKKHPVFVMLNFRPDTYDRYCPAEELIDNGFALIVAYYKDIATDDGDFSSGLAAGYDHEAYSWGKISMWAWGASRIVDYLYSRPEIDCDNIAVAGHSRLGKTALWCGAQDSRVKYVISNDSGCAGAAYERIKHTGAERVEDIVRVFPYWFCENYKKYAGHPEAMPFDQHFLIAASAPRYVCVGSASRDVWADPYSEQLCCIAASDAWNMLGHNGFSGNAEPAKVGQDFPIGYIGYHLRDGIHFFGRADWLQYMKFIGSKIR